MIRSRIALLALGALLLAGCVSPFSLVNGKTGFNKGRTMAVIAGLDNDPNVAMAQAMSEALQRRTRFKVMPYKQVAHTLKNYPSDIQGPWRSTYFEIEIDYLKTDLKKIRAIQQQLGVDYLYVLWTPSETVYNDKIHSLNVIGQMFESGKEIGNGRFNAVAGKTDCCLVPPPNDKDKADAVKDTSDYVAKDIGEKTGMLKQ